MKYLAILKDSLREAIDTKVIYFTMGLAALVILLVASVSFTPVAADEALKTITREFRVVFADHGNSFQPRMAGVKYEIEDLKQLNDAATPQEGDYRFLLVVSPPDSFQQAVSYWSNPPPQSDDEFLEKVKKKDSGSKKGWDAAFEALKVIFPAVSKSPVTRQQTEEFVRDQFAYYGNVTVTNVTQQPRKGGKLVFEVTTQGSRGVRGWLHDPALLFGILPMEFMRASLSSLLLLVTNILVGVVGAWVAILLSIIITAFFIPNMLRKGTIDLLLSKPINRGALLVYKFLGGLTFIFINTAFIVLGVFTALGLRSGVWITGFLWMIPILTFFFAILYALSALLGVLTRSAIVAILSTILFWFICFLAGSAYTNLYVVRQTPFGDKVVPWAYTVSNAVHAALPRTSDLGNLTSKMVYDQVLTDAERRRGKLDLLPQTNWAESFGVSFGWVVLLMGLACWRFAVKDY
jgi:ABC-type transport system involved in multi-copper enzyme maturation permease subunit